MRTDDTEVLLKIVVGGVRYRAQRHAIQIPIVTSVAEQLSECLDAHNLGVVWRHNLAKYLNEFVSKLSELKAKLGLHRNPLMVSIMS
jgi:hypothetical protein